MKSKTSATLLLALTFVLGGVTGAVSYRLYQNHVSAQEPRAARRPGPRDIIEEMARGLKLDEGQREQLRVIISQSRERYHALSEQFRPQYDAIRNETEQQIRQILREDQKALFEEKFKGPRDRRKNRGPHPTK